MKKQFFASCVGWEGDTNDLCDMIDSGKKISRQTFLNKCDVDNMVTALMIQYPGSYSYWKGTGKYQGIYWYENSCIEHFFR